MEKFIRDYVSDLKEFYQAFLKLLDEIGKNPTTFKVMLMSIN
ncbi:conserved hypothetical protein fragment 3 [Helicobacter acinonychis str. Sheeba]|uniref:Uncharacterized protein n=1 Tax=Helicobacter acinonychis (strain Sheeba) TaxID=382638 RepID=Q17YH1_HELAH|nr:conserved hypothetical protein fragment 3 [Helicobacter acinonychis str. Sheeba]